MIAYTKNSMNGLMPSPVSVSLSGLHSLLFYCSHLPSGGVARDLYVIYGKDDTARQELSCTIYPGAAEEPPSKLSLQPPARDSVAPVLVRVPNPEGVSEIREHPNLFQPSTATPQAGHRTRVQPLDGEKPRRIRVHHRKPYDRERELLKLNSPAVTSHGHRDNIPPLVEFEEIKSGSEQAKEGGSDADISNESG